MLYPENRSNFVVGELQTPSKMTFIHDSRFDVNIFGSMTLGGGDNFVTIANGTGAHPLSVTIEGKDTNVQIYDLSHNISLNLVGQGHFTETPLGGGNGIELHTAAGSTIALITKAGPA